MISIGCLMEMEHVVGEGMNLEEGGSPTKNILWMMEREIGTGLEKCVRRPAYNSLKIIILKARM